MGAGIMMPERQNSRNHLEQCGLAASVRPDNSDNLAEIPFEAEIIQDPCRALVEIDPHSFQRHLNITQTKSGAPIRAVITPTGNSTGSAITRAAKRLPGAKISGDVVG
jgi:hypothetical protein